jgi:MFS family permease
MQSYLGRIRGLSRDIRLFFVYNLFAVIAHGVFSIVFNLYLLELGMREDDIGTLSLVQILSMAVGGISLSFLVNRLGSWRCVAWGFILFLISSVAIAFAESANLLYLLSAFYGLGLAFLFNTTMPFLVEWGTPRERGQATVFSFSLISLSLTVGALVGGLLPGLLGSAIGSLGDQTLLLYRWTMVIGTLFAGAGLIPLWMMTEARSGRPAVHDTIVAEPVTASEFRRVRMDMGMFIAVGAVMSIGVGMVLPFYNVYLVTMGASTREVGYIVSLSGALAAVIGLTAPAMARQLGALNTVFILRTLSVPLFLLLIPFPSMAIGVGAFMIRQIGFSMAWPVDSVFIGEILPPKARAQVFGLRSAAWNFCSAIAAWAGGRIIVRSGYEWIFFSVAAFTGLSALMFTIYYRRHPLIKLEQIPSARSYRRQRDGELLEASQLST